MAEQYWHIVVPYDNNMLVLSYKYGVQMKVREDEDIKKKTTNFWCSDKKPS